jgi:hypothetical protein
VWNSGDQKRVLLLKTLITKGVCLQSAAQYRTYAQECRKLAEKLKPEHRETLMKIADAWDKCADEVDAARQRRGGLDENSNREGE